MTIPTNVQEAMDRITSAEPDGYNNSAFNISTNPYGFGSNGHRKNLFGTTNPSGTSLTNDVVTIAEWFDDQSTILDGYSVAAKKLAWYFTFSTTTTDADPGDGVFRLNNADPTLATYIYIDNVNADAVSATSWLATFDDSSSTVRGELTLVSASDTAVQYKYQVNGAVTAASGYYKIPVIYVAGGGTISGATQVGFSFSRTGDIGSTGATGPRGLSVGNQYQFDTNTTASDPTAGKIKFNSATPTSITQVYISETDYVGNSLASLIATWDDSTSPVRGHLAVWDPANPTHGVVLAVSGSVADNGTWDTLTVSHVAGATLPADAAVLSVAFYRTGNAGANGADGAAGPTGPTGRMAGIPMVYDGTGYTQVDPGLGKLRRNSATPALVTEIYISETDMEPKGVASWWASASSGTSAKRGRIDIFHETAPENFLSYDITGAISDQGGWDILTVTYRDHGGTLSDTDPLLVHAFASGDKGDTGAQGAPGDPGADGANGATGPIGPTVATEMLWGTGTADSDPGAGAIRANNSTYSSATYLYVDNVDVTGGAIDAWVDSWDDSTTTDRRGDITIKQVSDTTRWLKVYVSGVVVDGTGYRKVPVVYVAHNSAFQDGEEVSVEFVRTGDKGSDGAGAGNVNSTGGGYTAGHFIVYADTTGNAIQDGGAFTAATIPNVAAGNIAATNVQTAINELDTDKAPLASPSLTGTVDVTQAHLFSGVISPSQITADQDNYAPTGFSTCSVMRLTVDAARSITGIAGGAAGRHILILNIDATNSLTLKHDTTSTSANRFYCPNNADIVLLKNSGAWAWYDTTSSRWRVEQIGGNALSIYAAAQGTLAAGTVYSQLAALDSGVGGKANNGFVTFSGPTSSTKTFTLPNANETIACLGQNNTWTGAQSFNDGKLVLNGSSSGTTTLKATAVAGTTTITFPAVTDTAAVLGTAQTFTAAQTFPNASGVKIRDTDASHTLGLVGGSNLSADRTLTLTTGDANRTLSMSGDITTAGAFTLSGAYAATFTFTNTTTVTFPTSGTLVASSSLATVATSGSASDLSAGTLPDARLSSAATPYGKQAIPLPADSWLPATTNGAALETITGTNNERRVLSFDTSTQETAYCGIRMPKQWNESTLTFDVDWEHPSTTTNFGVVFELSAVAISNDDTADPAFGTAQTVTDTGGTTNDHYTSPESSAITAAGTPAENDYLMLRLRRVPANGSDTLAVDARVKNVNLYVTTNAGNDA